MLWPPAVIYEDGRGLIYPLSDTAIVPVLPLGKYAQIEAGRDFVCGT